MKNTPTIKALDKDLLRSKVLESEPFPNFCIDGFLHDEFAAQVCADYPSFERATAQGKRFSAVNEQNKVQITDASRFPESVRRLHEALASPEWLDTVSHALNIPDLIADPKLKGGGIHVTGPRGCLDVHIDFNYVKERQLYRRVNVLVFLNREWDESWGGFLELWDAGVRKCYRSFAPVFNRCVAFETSDISYHGVTAVRCPAGVSRSSFAAYYYTRQAPPGWNGEVHSTVFKARPDETYKRWIAMPVERLVRNARQKRRLLTAKVRGARRL